MAVTKYFYKDTVSGVFLINGNAIAKGNYNLLFYNLDTIVSLVDVSTNSVVLEPIEIINLKKENGSTYSTKAELITAIADLFSASGGGSGTMDHAVLTSNLGWSDSGHTGTANYLAGFGTSGEAVFVELLPVSSPVIDTGVMTLNCNNNSQAMFEGHTSVGTLIITDDFEIQFSNITGTKLISLILTLTDENEITFPNTVMCSNPSSNGTWAGNVLTLVSGTAVIVEFQLIWYATSSKWLLKVSEEAAV